MEERDIAPVNAAAGERDAEVENAHPTAVAGDWDAPTAGASPAGVPPGHLVIGTGGPLGDDPVTGSVVGEDWGRIPGAEADVEETAVRVFDEDSMV